MDNNARLLRQIAELSGEDVALCFQCGQCTGGCPVAEEMDPKPREAMLLLQLGMVDRVVNSRGIWLCASCLTCGTRCPRRIDYAKVAEACRAIVLRGTRSEYDPDNAIPAELEEVPQQAFIAAYRKFAG
ncbi:MAG TPA: heterodisulfide reductase [candidate division WOR-3 bacterium]|uniref:Heterodisulfide reductase n=1 Tax=candidate division WOR-3 bacterium TaxID=2052148 RepID=A0A7V0XEL5_UNCW3|nr:heterodisulfide reductase [candidate division WOR-3 bacterium]